MVLSDSIWRDCPDTGRITVSYFVFYHGVPIYDFAHVPVPFSQSSAESEYNAACTSGMVLAHFRILNNEMMKNDPDVVP